MKGLRRNEAPKRTSACIIKTIFIIITFTHLHKFVENSKHGSERTYKRSVEQQGAFERK
jgi:hypothetical protein